MADNTTTDETTDERIDDEYAQELLAEYKHHEAEVDAFKAAVDELVVAHIDSADTHLSFRETAALLRERANAIDRMVTRKQTIDECEADIGHDIDVDVVDD